MAGDEFALASRRGVDYRYLVGDCLVALGGKTEHWRGQGTPDYLQAVTEEPEDGGYALDGAPVGDDSPEESEYRRATQLVAESQKASTSWLQRQLRIGYNRAARHIERMEKEGLVSRPDHVGRREVLMDTEGRPLS